MGGKLKNKVQPILNFSLFCQFVNGKLDDMQFRALLIIGHSEFERLTEIGGDTFLLLTVEGTFYFFRVRKSKSINNTFKYTPTYKYRSYFTSNTIFPIENTKHQRISTGKICREAKFFLLRKYMGFFISTTFISTSG